MKTFVRGGRIRVIIYCRISDDREGERAGVVRQERDCRARADRNGWEIVAVLVENDLSAYSGKRRPEYERLLEMLRAGEADAVLALSPKRLYRQIKDAFEFFDLITERDIKVETLKQGRFDLSTAEGRRDARRAAIDGQYESEEIGERVRDAKADNLARGEFRGGPRPFGYEADGQTVRTLLCPSCPGDEGFASDRTCKACGADAVNEPGSEAWHADRAIDSVIGGDSIRSICHAWAELGIRTAARRRRLPDGTRSEPMDKEWEPTELRGMLLRPRNAGLIEHEGEVVGKAVWPGFTTEEKWRACAEILTNPERRTATQNARVWLGSGLYICHMCEMTVRAATSGVGGVRRIDGKSHRPSYRCRTGGHVVRGAVALDAYIEGLAVERLQRPDALDLLLPPAGQVEAGEGLAERANALRAKLDGYTADYDDDKITRKQFLDGTAKTRERLERLTAEMAGRASTSVLATLPLGTPEIEELWPKLHLDKRRVIINELMTVTILKAKRGRPAGHSRGQSYFDEDGVKVEWKHQAS